MLKTKRKVVFILLDAFRHDYINAVDTPFLYEATRRGIYAKKLKSTTGFTQRSAILTGSLGTETGMFTMYTFDEAASPFRFVQTDARIRWLLRFAAFVNQVPECPGLRRVARLLKESFERKEESCRKWIHVESKKYAHHASPAYIPLKLLPYIGVSEDNRPIHLPGAMEQETVFDVFSRELITYQYFMFPVVNCDDEEVLRLILAESESAVRVILGQFSDSDLLIHEYGPNSEKRGAVVGEIDRRLRMIANQYGSDTTWVIIGDHGMASVEHEFDISRELEPLEKLSGVRRGRDYLLFLDSTMARFRWCTQAGQEFLDRIRQSNRFNNEGRFIDAELASRYAIPLKDRRYGDLIWWANVGTLIFPDYFHNRQTHNKGMHGYDSEHDDMKGFFLAFGPGIGANVVDQAQLIDVCPSLCAAVGVPPPRSNEGVSLLS